MKLNKYNNYHSGNSLTDTNIFSIYIFIIKKIPFLNKKLEIILNLPKQGKILDVGCGAGSFLRIVKKLRPDLKLYGVDISDDGFKFINFKANLTVSSGDNLSFKDNFFDLVISQHVLEHVNNPEDFLFEFKRVSNKYIILVAPNYKNLFLWDKVNFYSDYTHIKPFTKSSFKKLALQNKLNILKLNNERYVNIPWIILILLFPLYLYRGGISDWFANILFKRAVIMICKK